MKQKPTLYTVRINCVSDRFCPNAVRNSDILERRADSETKTSCQIASKSSCFLTIWPRFSTRYLSIASAQNDTWEWDGSTWSQKSLSTSPPARSFHAMAALGDKVLLFGGSGASVLDNLDDTWEWDGTDWLQKLPSLSPSMRREHAMARLSTNVVLFGGLFVDSYRDTWNYTDSIPPQS